MTHKTFEEWFGWHARHAELAEKDRRIAELETERDTLRAKLAELDAIELRSVRRSLRDKAKDELSEFERKYPW